MRTIHLKNVLEMPEHIDWHVKTKNTTHRSSLKKPEERRARLACENEEGQHGQGRIKGNDKRSILYATTKREKQRKNKTNVQIGRHDDRE